MSGGRKAALALLLMAVLSFTGFYIYARNTGDNEGIRVGMITGGMMLFLAVISFIEIRPWKR